MRKKRVFQWARETSFEEKIADSQPLPGEFITEYRGVGPMIRKRREKKVLMATKLIGDDQRFSPLINGGGRCMVNPPCRKNWLSGQHDIKR